MKKLIIYVAVLAVASLAACSGNKQNEAKTECSSIYTKIENCTNPDSLKVYVDQAKAYAQKLVDEGKIAEAQQFLNKITPTVEQKAPALAGVLTTAKETLAKIPGQATDSLKNAVTNAVDTLGAKASDVKDAVTDKTKEIASDVKDAAANTYNDVKNGTKDAVTNAAQGATNAINNAIGK